MYGTIGKELDGFDITVYPQTDSTSLRAREDLLGGRKPPFLILAEHQTAGAGRRGNTFACAPRGGIYMTLALAPDAAMTEFPLTARAAVAVHDAILAVTGADCGIKWVNDLYLDGKKVCGILAQTVCDPDSLRPIGLLLGIGINTQMHFDASLAAIAGNLPVRDGQSAILVSRIVRELLAEKPKEKIISRYRALSCVLGRPVRYTVDGIGRVGLAVSIADDGALTVSRDGITETLRGGEISVKI